jgi:hypothetical protein
MKRFLALAMAMASLLAARPAFPCGGGFGPGIRVNPQQDIIVVWKDGIETYVFQPTFCGTATNFGLILPVPAQLTQEPTLSDQQAFTTAIALTEPKKVEKDMSGPAIGCGSSDNGATDGTNRGPTVVASGRVGFLDWIQLKAENQASFTNWLTANGYPFPDVVTNYADNFRMRSVFDYYVTQGWYFLAFKISQDAVPDGGTVCKSLGPVSFAFPTSAPVVPSRMASAGSTMTTSSFTWRVFGITQGDVQLDAESGLAFSGAIPDSAVAALAGLAQPGDRVTRLNLTFSPSRNVDVALRIAPAVNYQAIEYVPASDSTCAVRKAPHSRTHALLALLGLTLVGLIGWRRWR